jgi:hypothetical protein
MTDATPFALLKRNPDVLTCIANLSNDEVFTPPEFAARMLDTLAEGWATSNDGANIWADSSATFLDPCTKSGVFLREIAKRLIDGLEDEIPHLQTRVDHILTKQLFGIGITRLTSLLARRSLYCSKWANGDHSVTRGFDSEDGNVWFGRTEHEWVAGRCKHCGASREAWDRGDDVENHAYAFIHTRKPKAWLAEKLGAEMQFDVIIGNPPYQLSDGGQGASAVPIYNKFVDQAKSLQPRMLSMVIPARWFFGGRGLDAFRKSMLEDERVRSIVDFPDSRQCFPSVDVAGGICYFLWNRDNPGDCEVVNFEPGGEPRVSVRPLLEVGSDIFIRDSRHIEILKKISAVETGGSGVGLPAKLRFDQKVSGQKPFGLRTFFRGTQQLQNDGDLIVLQSGGRAWTPRETITEGTAWIDKWKVFTSKSSSEHAGQVDKNGMRKVLSLSGVLPPGSVVTETYVLLGTFDTEFEARNCFSYAATKFFRFLVAVRASAQDLPRSAYSFVPIQDFSQKWSDASLYKRYGLTDEEIALIESTIRPMESAA